MQRSLILGDRAAGIRGQRGKVRQTMEKTDAAHAMGLTIGTQIGR